MSVRRLPSLTAMSSCLITRLDVSAQPDQPLTLCYEKKSGTSIVIKACAQNFDYRPNFH